MYIGMLYVYLYIDAALQKQITFSKCLQGCKILNFTSYTLYDSFAARVVWKDHGPN